MIERRDSEAADLALDGTDLGTAYVADLDAKLRVLIERGDRLVKINFCGEVAYLVLNFADVSALLGDEVRVPAWPEYDRNYAVQGRHLLRMTGEEHRIHRALVARAFGPGAVRAMVEDALIPIGNGLIDKLARGVPVDLIAAYVKPYAFAVISHMLGVPPADEEQVKTWVYGMFAGLGPGLPEEKAARQRQSIVHREELDAYMIPIIDERRKSPQADLISRMATAETEGHKLSDEEILTFVRMLYPAGADTTYHSMGAMMNQVLGDEDLRDLLVRDKSKHKTTVEESLRKFPAVAFVQRYLQSAQTICDVEVPAGATVLYSILAANADPAVCQNPAFSIDRESYKLASFGGGIHFCLGNFLAREELRISLGLLLDRLPGLRLATGVKSKIEGLGLIRGVSSLFVEFDDVVAYRDPMLALAS